MASACAPCKFGTDRAPDPGQVRPSRAVRSPISPPGASPGPRAVLELDLRVQDGRRAVVVDDGAPGPAAERIGSVLRRCDGDRPVLPPDQVLADRVPPVDPVPVGGQRVVLVEGVEPAVHEDRAVGVVHPAGRRGQVVSGPNLAHDRAEKHGRRRRLRRDRRRGRRPRLRHVLSVGHRRRRRPGAAQRAVQPPSINSVAPVIRLAAGDARNTTAPATSIGSPIR